MRYAASKREMTAHWRGAVAAAALLLAGCGDHTGASSGNGPHVERVTSDTLSAAYPGADDWHFLALHGNWDYVDTAAWRAIVTHPDCDRATALAIFWKASPEYYVQFADREAVPVVNRDGYDLIVLIRERWDNGAYSRGALEFDPETDAWPIDFAGLRERYGTRVEQLMPARMRVRLEGRRLDGRGFRSPGLPGAG